MKRHKYTKKTQETQARNFKIFTFFHREGFRRVGHLDKKPPHIDVETHGRAVPLAFQAGVRTGEPAVRKDEARPDGAGFQADRAERHIRPKPGKAEKMDLVPKDHPDEIVRVPGGEPVERMFQQGVDAARIVRAVSSAR